jgi:hypothetical protein
MILKGRVRKTFLNGFLDPAWMGRRGLQGLSSLSKKISIMNILIICTALEDVYPK